MSNSTPNTRIIQSLLTLVFFLLVSSAITLTTLAHRPKQIVSTPKVVPVATPKLTPPQAPAVAPKYATTNASVYVRSGKGTNSSILGVLDSGVTVTLGNDSDVNWQEITAGTLHGYVFKSYLKY